MNAEQLVIKEFQSLRGRLCTIIESANLPKRQEKALITMIKQLSYQNQAVVIDVIKILENDQEFEYSNTKVTKIDN